MTGHMSESKATRRRASSPARAKSQAAGTKDATGTVKRKTAASLPSASWLSAWWPDGVGGISSKGIFGTTATWVDLNLRPGHTDQTEVLSLRATLNSVATLRHFFMAPHFTWAVMALFMNLVVPLEESIAMAKEGWSVSWTMERFALNLSVALAYYGYFHVGLWHLGWANRKFLPDVFPTPGNMLHNLWYWFLGIVQWTFWECVMVRLWATGKVPYVTNEALLADWRVFATNLVVVLLTPCWRDVHFYIVHRFSHIRAIYKYVHSLHHRNTDPEPFSGLCMHPCGSRLSKRRTALNKPLPDSNASEQRAYESHSCRIEHLYYYSNAWTPALYLTLSPFVFLYTFVHLTIAPGAGHSGWEDHFQSDQYHYLHHAKFECNYGSPFSACIDMACGTFREGLGASSHYAGEWSEAAVKAAKNMESTPGPKKVWSKHSYLGLPASFTDGCYTLFWVSLVPLMAWAAIYNHPVPSSSERVDAIYGWPISTLIAVIVAYGPILVALLLAKLSGDRMSWRWPFHKERLAGTLGVFLVLGWLAVLLPTYHAVVLISE